MPPTRVFRSDCRDLADAYAHLGRDEDPVPAEAAEALLERATFEPTSRGCGTMQGAPIRLRPRQDMSASRTGIEDDTFLHLFDAWVVGELLRMWRGVEALES